jgi:enterochelin esterase-like enzyme
MPGPNSLIFLTFLVLLAGVALFAAVRCRLLPVKIASCVGAFAVSTFFGVALVNNFYDYYTSWGSLYADMTNGDTVDYQASESANQQLTESPTLGRAPGPAPGSRPRFAAATSASNPSAVSRAVSHTKIDVDPLRPASASSADPSRFDVPATLAIPDLHLSSTADSGSGRLVRLNLPGSRSGINRVGYVYLPPQYFEPSFDHVRFPVLELLHGDPGNPTNWIYGLHLLQVMDSGIGSGQVGPMVIVMPATFTGKHGADCVNAVHGAADDSYLSEDVPSDVFSDFRVLAPGPNWGIGGLSDGGYCAANLALRHRGSFGAVASMDGFYTVDADLDVLAAALGGDAEALTANDPSDEVIDPTRSLPRFWIMSGTGNGADADAAKEFRELVETREPVRDVVLAGGRHTPSAWRAVLPQLLQWTWTTLSGQQSPVGTDYSKVAAPQQVAPLLRSPTPPLSSPSPNILTLPRLQPSRSPTSTPYS